MIWGRRQSGPTQAPGAGWHWRERRDDPRRALPQPSRRRRFSGVKLAVPRLTARPAPPRRANPRHQWRRNISRAERRLLAAPTLH